MRIGIFGGTFDPIHLGHLILAEHCREAHELDRVLFVPAGQPPHKSAQAVTSGRLRLEMVELAVVGQPDFEVSTIEIDREGPSYTADTIHTIATQNPDAELYLLIGSDSLADLPNWYQPARIASLATIVVATRPGAKLPSKGPLAQVFDSPTVERILRHVVRIPQIGISSSHVRTRAAREQSIRYLVPRAVECFIAGHGLYQAPPA